MDNPLQIRRQTALRGTHAGREAPAAQPLVRLLVVLILKSIAHRSIIATLGTARSNGVMDRRFDGRVRLLLGLPADPGTEKIMKNRLKVYRAMHDLT
jgi:hypothetical protein